MVYILPSDYAKPTKDAHMACRVLGLTLLCHLVHMGEEEFT